MQGEQLAARVQVGLRVVEVDQGVQLEVLEQLKENYKINFHIE